MSGISSPPTVQVSNSDQCGTSQYCSTTSSGSSGVPKLRWFGSQKTRQHEAPRQKGRLLNWIPRGSQPFSAFAEDRGELYNGQKLSHFMVKCRGWKRTSKTFTRAVTLHAWNVDSSEMTKNDSERTPHIYEATRHNTAPARRQRPFLCSKRRDSPAWPF